MKITKEELFTIPNLLGYFRLLMIPVFCWLFLTDRYAASVAVLVISSLTDMADGKIARHFHMITDWGKFLDPVADKLTHAALAVCLSTRYPIMWLLFALMAVKEIYMLTEGWIRMRRKQPVQGAKWYGKVCTAYLFVMMAALVVFPQIPAKAVTVLVVIGLFFMIQSMILYFRFFRSAEKKEL